MTSADQSGRRFPVYRPGEVRAAARKFARLVRMHALLEGVTPDDAKVLRSGFRKALRHIVTDPDSWKYTVFDQDLTLKVRDFGSFAVRANSDDIRHILPSTQRLVSETVRAELKQGDIAVDAGANVGVVSLLMSQAVGPEGRVLAIEMIPETYARLQDTIERNDCGNVTAEQVALDQAAGSVVEARIPTGGEGESAKFGCASIEAAFDNCFQTASIATQTLDNLTAELPRIDLIKFDLEGAEARALRGAKGTLAKTRAIIMETQGREDDEAAKILRDAGFVLQQLDGNNVLAKKTATG